MVQNTMDAKYIWSSSIKDGLVWFNPEGCKRQRAIIFSDILSESLGFGILSSEEPTKSRRWIMKRREGHLAMVAADSKLG
jgi:hypothetical protein